MKIFKAAIIMVTILFVGAISIFVFNIQRSSKNVSGKLGTVLLKMIASENTEDQSLYYKISDTLAFQISKDYKNRENIAVTAVVTFKDEVFLSVGFVAKIKSLRVYCNIPILKEIIYMKWITHSMKLLCNIRTPLLLY